MDQSIPLIDKPHQLPNIETETMDPKKTNVTYDKNVTSDMHQVKPEKYINKELPKNKENHIINDHFTMPHTGLRQTKGTFQMYLLIATGNSRLVSFKLHVPSRAVNMKNYLKYFYIAWFV